MKIAYIATGAAGMICGTCLHDNTLAAALQKMGHDVALIPTYTPIRTDENNVSIEHIFFGGVNVYLQEKLPLFRHTPAAIDNLLSGRKLLNWMSKFSASTSAKDLGALTVSMLRGESGNQFKELAKLVNWLKQKYRPEIVQLNHAMLLGFAAQIKRELHVPVVCGVQGEDLFLNDLIEPYKSQAMALLRQRVRDVDAVIATCDAYADFMADYLCVPKRKMHTVRLGINLDGHGAPAVGSENDLFRVGYLARLCPEKGLHLLVDAFHRLWQKYGTERVQLRLAGFPSKKDAAYVAGLQREISDRNMDDAVDYVGEVDRAEKISFLNNVDVLSVPTVYKEPKGLFVLEAMANGIPVVQPAHGAFPEIIERTGGGLLVTPDSVDDLAGALDKLYNDKKLRTTLGERGKKAVHAYYSDNAMADATLAVYRRVMSRSEQLDLKAKVHDI